MKPTIYDIAQKAGVSAATVSNVVNSRGRVGEETRKKVLKVMDELHYRPNLAASVLKGKPARTIGFFVPDMLNPIYMEYVKYAEERAQACGFSIIMCSTENDPQKERVQADILRQKNVDGFIITSKFQNEQLLQELEQEGFPSLCLAHERNKFQFDSVTGDDEQAGQMAAEYLVSLNHINVAMIAEKDSLSSPGRITGFQKRFHELGKGAPPVFYAEASIELAKKVAKEVIQEKKTTALFGGNDVIAVGIIQAARELNLSIPAELSVIGLDNTFLCEIVSPQLTAISMPVKKISYKGIDLLIDKMKTGRDMRKAAVYPPALVERVSAQKRKK